jgi:putative ABC transport system permease protein
MVLQLLLIGYLLLFIFNRESPIFTVAILTLMLLFASHISLRPLKKKKRELYLFSLIAILISGVFTLFLIIFGIMKLKVWYEPRVIIPLAGMIFANSMNSISLFAKSYEHNRDGSEAIKISLIPTINSFFAVGLVSLPGMMTGQILTGVDPLIAVRYQIMVMLMVLNSNGFGVMIFYHLLKKFEKQNRD